MSLSGQDAGSAESRSAARPADGVGSTARPVTFSAAGGRAWWMLAVLTLLLIVSFLDRTVLSLLVAPIKTDLRISDSQFALVYGLSFAVFFGLIGFPVARLVDRGPRKLIIVAGALIWGAATIMTGLAQSFVALLGLRMLLAIGEATLSPATASLIGDSFPLKQRVIANSIYAAGSQLGFHGSLALGGLLIAAIGSSSVAGLHGWRLVFLLAALPAVLLAAIFAASVREPERTRHDPEEDHVRNLKGLFEFLGANGRLYAGFLLGATGPAVLIFACSAWMPELLVRGFGLDIPGAGVRLGAVGLLAGLAGTFVAPLTASRLISVWPSAPATINLIFAAVGCASGIAMSLQSSLEALLLLYGITIFTLTGVCNGTLVGLQLIVPRRALGTIHSLGNICITVFGLAIGPSALAALATSTGGTASLQPALALLTPLAIVPSMILLALARKPMAARIRQVLAREGLAGPNT